MRKLSAFLTATVFEFGILFLITGLLSPLPSHPEIPQKPLMVKLSIISFKNPSTTQRIVTTYPETAPTIRAETGKIEPSKTGVKLEKPIPPFRSSIRKGYELPELKFEKSTFETGETSNFVVEKKFEEFPATHTLQPTGESRKDFKVPTRVPRKRLLVSKKVEFEMPTGVFKAEEFLNFYEIKDELERKYRELLNRRKMDRAILEGSVEVILILKADGSVDVHVKKASAVELESLVISTLSKLKTRRHAKEQRIKVTINLGGRVAIP
ncbi:MAG: hypothetical protein J7L52_08550 [Thermotogae bacterium]|nr:hypothetical protein [Thermotogota bacterium]